MISISISNYFYSWQLNSIRDDFWKELAAAKNEILLRVCDGNLAQSSIARDNAVPHPGVRKISTEI
jgi:hypothetical protein